MHIVVGRREGRAVSETTKFLMQSCINGDLEGVKAALQRGNDVNSKDERGMTGLMNAVIHDENSVVAFLLNTPNIDVNQKDDEDKCALHKAASWKNIEALKLLLEVPNIDVNIVDHNGLSALDMACCGKSNEALKVLLNVPTIDVNIVDNNGYSAVHTTVFENRIDGLKLLLSHPSLTALTLNQKDKRFGCTPVMLAVKLDYWRLEYLEVLVADPRVNLDTTDKEGTSLKKAASSARDRGEEREKVVAEAMQRREERRRLKRLIREQQRQVSKVLLDGLYDPDSPFSKLLGVRTEVVGEIIWQKLVENWQIFPGHHRSSDHLSARKINCRVQ